MSLLKNVFRQLKLRSESLFPKHSGVGANSSEANSSEANSSEYWTSHNVTLHRQFSSLEDSISYFQWRNDQYFGYIDLMPVNQASGLTVLDFGCGPGNDLAGFSEFSHPKIIYGADVSPLSLAEARSRLRHHAGNVELIQLDSSSPVIQLPDKSIDLIHCSGVLHHIPDPRPVLLEFKRILNPSGELHIMVYNKYSIWYNLYCAYQLKLLSNEYQDCTIDEVFRRSTDGVSCPVSRAYVPKDFVSLLRECGLEGRHAGNAISAFEMSVLPLRYSAIMDQRLDAESRKFLSCLEFDNRAIPTFRGMPAGIDACFHGRHL